VVVLLRWVLIISCSCLVLFHDHYGANKTVDHLVVLCLIFSNVILALLPEKLFTTSYFDHCLVTFDIGLITASIYLSGEPKSELYLLYFLVIMIAAVGETLRAIIWSAVLVAVVYLCAMASIGGSRAVMQPEILIRIPFFFVVALFYGYLAQLVRSERSEKVVYQKELSATKQVREISNLLSRSLDRKTILETLVQAALEFCKADYCAVLSRGAEAVLAEAGTTQVSSPKKVCSMLLTDLARRIEQNGEGQENADPQVLPVDESELELVSSKSRRLCFVNDSFTFLPFNGELDSDLYLCLVGQFESDLVDYAELLLLSAAMALHNAGQYQALVHEAEKRQEMVRHLGSALKFKSEFAANITHEIRTPIYAFIGFAELLLEEGYGKLEGEQRQVIHRMLDKARDLLELVNNILDHAKLESGEYKLIISSGKLQDFLDEIIDACEPLLKDNPVSLHSHCEEEIPLVVTDWGIVRQIAMNLVSNAVKFTPKGRVDIYAGYDSGKSHIYFRVSDTGMGIAPDKISQIFEAFRQLENSYTKKYAGTGLGLAITKRQVEMLGGHISVESKVNYGSEFTVYLPVKVTPGKAEVVSVTGTEQTISAM
jgi:signal transduction histidine kinase